MERSLQAKTKQNILLFWLLGAFAVYAIYVVLFGTLSTTMMDFYAINTGAQGVFTMVSSFGGIAAALFCALFGERFSKLWAIMVGALFLGAASLCIGLAPPYLLVCLCSLLCGVGYTIIDVMGNAAVTEYFPNRTKTLLPMIQIIFGLGTMVGPFLATLLLTPGMSRSFVNPFLMVGVLGIVVMIFYSVSLKRATPFLHGVDLKSMASSAKQNPGEIFRSWKSWTVMLACSLFCAFNTTIIAWYPTFFSLDRGMDAEGAALVLTLFYLGILVMRIISPLVFKKIQPQKVFVYFSIISIVFMLIAINTQSIPAAMVLSALGGAFSSLNIVCVIMIATELFPTRKASATSLAVFSYNIGGMIAPFAVGVAAETVGLQLPLSIMCGVFACGVVVMAVLSHKCKAELKNI
ncbi:MAG: MFS transporter [Christensenella sp.]|uniref:MFS transporter n=1 Tax=Christensenella sp. TaxID=1935934 RepID=UPI002B220AEF|nr:MFS transporter [Christensenella sp.]MEA5002098.1 MFS transporter [Christensenella sp.]